MMMNLKHLQHVQPLKALSGGLMAAGLIFVASGCSTPISPESALARTGDQAIPVDVAVARLATLGTPVTFTGTTRANQDVILRSQVEGQVLSLGVDVGDRVTQGQVLARIDAALLQAALIEAESELAARRSEVIQAQTEVNNARTAVEQARLNLQQAQSDAQRLQQLLKDGAIAAQATEQAVTTAKTQQQVLQSSQAQVRTAQQGVAVAQGRVQAQAALVAQNRARLAYAIIRSPISGVVLERLTETGNLIQPGGELVRLGNLTQLKVIVELSERELPDVRVGQVANVQLDAAGNRSLTGRISRISPAADATARLIPVEIILNNPQGEFGTGLLARVTFLGSAPQRVIIPQTALAGEDEGRVSTEKGTVYVVDQDQVQARPVQLGNRRNSQVEIIAGLKPGEEFVVRSGRPLKSGDTIRASILSENSESSSPSRTESSN